MVIKIFKCIKPAKITNKLKNFTTNFKKHFYVALKLFIISSSIQLLLAISINC